MSEKWIVFSSTDRGMSVLCGSIRAVKARCTKYLRRYGGRVDIWSPTSTKPIFLRVVENGILGKWVETTEEETP